MDNTALQTKKEENKRFRQIALNELVNGKVVYLMAFVVPLIIMVAIYAARGIYPFGHSCYLRSDIYHQYCPFFTELWDKLRSGESLSYTWDIGLGSNFLAIFGYYLSSPTNWFVALFPQEYMIEVMNVIILLKTSAASLTCTYFLCKRNNKIHLSAAAFGIFYGLSGYIAAFSWNLMWLDCVLLLPLIFLGIDKLVREGKGLLYTITLGLAILSNYYIAIMVCISCVIYFLVSAVSMPVQKDGMPYVKALLHFILYSILAGGLAAVILLPEIYALEYTASSDFNFPDNFNRYFSFVTVFQRHLMNIEVSTGLDHLPNIYCGVAVLLLTPIYMVCNKIPLRERIMKVLALIIFYTAFNLNIPNFIWHGFHYPNSLPCRQSFIYIFLIITIGYDVVRNIKHLTNSQLSIGLWSSLIFLMFLGHTLDDDLDFNVLYISAFFIALYAFAMYLYKHNKVNRCILSIIVFALAVTECTINMENTGYSTTSRTYYFRDYKAINTLLDDLETEDKSFYRMTKFDGFRSKNDSAWHDFKSGSIFSSTAYEGVTDLYDRLGLEHSMNAYAVNGSTPLVYSMFNVKYMLSDEEIAVNPLVSLKDMYDDDNITEYLYENKYTLPLGFMVPADFNQKWVFEENANPFEVQNAFAESVAGITDLFTPVEFYDNFSTATLTTTKDQYIFVRSQNNSIDTLSITVGSKSTNFPAIKHGRTADLGYVKAGTEINISDSESNSGSLQLIIYTMDTDKFIKLYESLADEGLNITKYDDNHVEGTITVKEDGLCFTSIPYDESFTLYVDGVKTEFEETADALIAFPLTQGAHTIELDYTPRGVVPGGIISIICLLIVIGCIVFAIKYKKECSEDGAIDIFIESLSKKKSVSDETDNENETTDRKDESQ